MDRWPSEREEPKAPDKNLDALNPKDSNLIMKLKSEQNFTNCGKTDDFSPRVLPPSKESSVSSLNEPDLKALLEEAMAYKRPKDIQGKSDLFKELLQSVECEKKYSLISRPEKQSNRKPRRKQMNKKEIEKTTHEGPFQDLIVHMSDCDSSKRQMKYSLKCSPSNVAQLVPIDATALCNEGNPEVSALLENGSIDSIEELQGMLSAEANIYQVKALPVGPGPSAHHIPSNSYHKETEDEAEARVGTKDCYTLSSPPRETGDVSEGGKDALIESKRSLDENGNSVSGSRVESLAEKKAKARRLKAKNDKNTILSHQIEGHRSDIAQDIDAIMKYIESPKSSDSKNSGRQRNAVGLSKNSSRTSSKISRVRDKSTEALSRKSPKNKGSKLQKSSSLEEVSITKFEDLTQAEGVQRNFGSSTNHKIVKDRNVNVPSRSKSDTVSPIPPVGSPQHDRYELESADNDFLPVTKKNRKKKFMSENNTRNERRKMSGSYRSDKMLSSYMSKSQKLDGFPSSSREVKRRKSISSIPSSDKSGDSSDLDSVHSFPVSSNKGKSNKSSVTQYTGSTPQISYADIARSVPSPSRLQNELSPSTDNIGECDNDSFQKESIPTVIFQLPSKKEGGQSSLDLQQDYPPLNIKSSENNFTSSDMFVEYTVHVPKRNSCTSQSNCVCVEETVLVEMPSSDISEKEGINVALDNQLSSKRPPVILMNSFNDSNEVNDLVFGFEVNEQLLSGSITESTSDSEKTLGEADNSRVSESSGIETASNYDEPLNKPLLESRPETTQNDLDIVQFVSSEWRKAVCELREAEAGAKVIYFHNIP